MRAIRAVVFDLDGVLIDSEPVWERVRRALVTEHGGTYRDDATRAIMGMSAPEWSHYIRVELGVDLPEPRIVDMVVAGLVASYERALPLVPGALEAVRAIAACVPVAIASASNRALIDLVVDRAGLGDVMRVTVAAEEVGRGKPAPDVYLAAASRLGVEPAFCGAVEDSSNGIRSAHASGMFVVAIPNRAFPPSREAVSLAGAELRTIAELGPATFELTPVDRSRAKRSG